MWLTIKKLFKHDYLDKDVKINHHLPQNEEAKFLLTIEEITIGILSYKDNTWYFKYTEEFKNHLDEYNLIIGFSDVNKIYESTSLWPFFQIRIPGLKQPAIKEILKKENINENDQVSLLKLFGKRTIANPYELELG